MPIKTVSEARKVSRPDGGNGRKDTGPRGGAGSGDGKILLVSHEIVRLVEASRRVASPSAAGQTSSMGCIGKLSRV